MGKRLAKRDVKPDLIVSSPAVRALTTAQLIADEIGYERRHIAVDDRLYASSAGDLLSVIRALDKKLQRVMLFGHNPSSPTSRAGCRPKSRTCQPAPSQSSVSTPRPGRTLARSADEGATDVPKK